MKSIEQRQFAANDARQLMDNPLLRMAFDGVAEYLESQALSCPPDDKDKAQRIVQGKQILVGIKREIERIIEDGTVAEVQLAEIERKKPKRFFSRF